MRRNCNPIYNGHWFNVGFFVFCISVLLLHSFAFAQHGKKSPVKNHPPIVLKVGCVPEVIENSPTSGDTDQCFLSGDMGGGDSDTLYPQDATPSQPTPLPIGGSGVVLSCAQVEQLMISRCPKGQAGAQCVLAATNQYKRCEALSKPSQGSAAVSCAAARNENMLYCGQLPRLPHGVIYPVCIAKVNEAYNICTSPNPPKLVKPYKPAQPLMQR